MAAKATRKNESTHTRRALVNLLKQEGAMDSQAIASHLGVSAMAVRQHLYALQEQKLVTYTEEPRAMGRPAKLWRLTAEANRLFPDGYAELTLGLLQSVVEAFGDGGLDRILDVRTRHQVEDYTCQLAGIKALPDKLQVLAQQRTDEGYMAEVETLDDGSWLLIENHCPICAAASACTGLCDRELQVFQTVLGQDVRVERTEHIISGARRCVYQVQQAS